MGIVCLSSRGLDDSAASGTRARAKAYQEGGPKALNNGPEGGTRDFCRKRVEMWCDQLPLSPDVLDLADNQCFEAEEAVRRDNERIACFVADLISLRKSNLGPMQTERGGGSRLCASKAAVG
eukprot:NODE_5180_length_709_cov_34.992424_g4812_i0.p1 GENE.NODE_5180_length_709_cov_34.992424_g4812_i0~~NODE_5180_length_709_cov_34.992424_g4812_i0.p1  ORF type:complete len:122 (+),score=8.34 NODE_5180_length_709_cov_34.992424_g4812_i0:59-424(+)